MRIRLGTSELLEHLRVIPGQITPLRDEIVNLRDIELKVGYRSDGCNLVTDFYIPCLSSARLYRRAVGYFTSGSLSIASQGLAKLIENGGRMQLVASPHFTDEDIQTIRRGYEDRLKVFQNVTSRSFKDISERLVADRLNALAWLISESALDVRIAFAVDPFGVPTRGLYHEKVGIFSDDTGDSIAFSGSANETIGGLVDNFEAVDVYWSWDDPHKRVPMKIDAFSRLWNNQTSRLEVMDFTDSAAEILERFRTIDRPKTDPEENQNWRRPKSEQKFGLPVTIELREYQNEAIRNWMMNNGRGLLKMATGSGKTITSLAAAAELVQKIELKVLLVVCPFRHLVLQWDRECRKFGVEPVLAFESVDRWLSSLSTKLYNASNSTGGQFLCVITTNATFSSEAFQRQLQHFPKKTMLIADEVHNLGATKLRRCLPESIRLRLGLSATPERWFDSEGTQGILDYFGRVLDPEFTIRDALRVGALVPYRYIPVMVELTSDELDKYLSLSEQISRLFAIQRPTENGADGTSPLQILLSQRARLTASAYNKIYALKQIVLGRSDWKQTLFYCGDGSVSDDNDESGTQESLRQVEAVCKVLGNELSLKVAPYTFETAIEERELLRRSLENGDLDGLVAIRCLDEGVDIPSVKTAVILASTTNPRQFIQRRGRVLRPAMGKDSADIYDMIVVPPAGLRITKFERQLLKKELARFVEFADMASNSGEARGKMLSIQDRFELLDM